MLRFILIGSLLWAGSGGAQVAEQSPVSCDDTSNTSASPRFGKNSSGNAIPGNVSKLPMRSLLYRGSTTRIYTRYMPWFGDGHHRDVGYRSDDRQQVSRQVADMLSRGVQGAIVDWYGPGSGLKQESALLLLKESERQGLEFAVSEDAGALGDCEKRGCDETAQLVSDLRYAAEHLEGSPAYLRFHGRPAVFFFGLEKYKIDWRRVRQAVPLNPLFFFRNSGAFADADADGAYSWMAPEAVTPDDPMALKYLERFYSKAQPSSKIAMGSAYKGFSDADAVWGKGRVIDQQCGQTWMATLAAAGRFYTGEHQLPALIIPTWNDYEEGTEIETGIDNCVRVRASLRDRDLVWTIDGRENTIDHYGILVREENQWQELTEVPPGSHSVPLPELHLPPEVRALCVQAVGKASLLNHVSGPVEISPAAAQKK
jgi:hypothetical protein